METWLGVSSATAMAASSIIVIVCRWGGDSTRMYSVRTCGVTTAAPRIGELECLEPSVYVNVVLSYRRAGAEKEIEGGEIECGEGRGVAVGVGASFGGGVVEVEATERIRQPGCCRRRWVSVSICW